MTPNTDEELRQQVLAEFKQVLRLAPADYTENCTNVVMRLIKSREERLVREAEKRIVEQAIMKIPAVDFSSEPERGFTMAARRPVNKASYHTGEAAMRSRIVGILAAQLREGE